MTENEREELKRNVGTVLENIARAAQQAGRRPEEITLVAATKMNDAERVRAALESGVPVAGENRVQELLDKYEQGAYLDKPLHFIGTLQRNKVKYLMGKVALIQSVGSLQLAQTIDKEAAKHGLCQDILLEINIGREAAKSGIDPDSVFETIEEIGNLSHIKLRGLMAIPPVVDDSNKKSHYFVKMQQLQVDISSKKYDNISMDILSMGMSGDYMDAISCGSTMVRVGTAIFGARQYPT